MPSYKVLKPCFLLGRLHAPGETLSTDEPFPKKNGKEQIPSSLEPCKGKTEKKNSKRNDKVKQDKQEIENASFLGEGEKADHVVETL